MKWVWERTIPIPAILAATKVCSPSPTQPNPTRAFRAVDAGGKALDLLILRRPDQQATEAFLQRVVEVYSDESSDAVTDKPRSHGPLIKKILL